jgi:hypothetical protein
VAAEHRVPGEHDPPALIECKRVRLRGVPNPGRHPFTRSERRVQTPVGQKAGEREAHARRWTAGRSHPAADDDCAVRLNSNRTCLGLLPQRGHRQPILAERGVEATVGFVTGKCELEPRSSRYSCERSRDDPAVLLKC